MWVMETTHTASPDAIRNAALFDYIEDLATAQASSGTFADVDSFDEIQLAKITTDQRTIPAAIDLKLVDGVLWFTELVDAHTPDARVWRRAMPMSAIRVVTPLLSHSVTQPF